METKRDFEARAKALISVNSEEAIKLYLELSEKYPDEFNLWDAFYTIKTMRTVDSPNLKWATELARKFNDEKVCNLYGWLIFDKCVKGKIKSEHLSNEIFIAGLPNISPQKNLREDGSFPCPTTICILKLCDAYAENLFNAKRINELLIVLDYTLLSDKPKTIDTQDRGEIELSSDLEKYFALRTKALLKLGKFEECIEFCNIGLIELQKFHYNNDLWLKMRIALCKDGLGNFGESEVLFKGLLESKAGADKWFLYRDISEVYFEQKDFLKAWKYAIDGAFYGNEPHYLIGLYLLQARILFKLKREKEGQILAELIAVILKEQGWSDKVEYSKLFLYYKIDREKLPPLTKVIQAAKEFWKKERYGDIEKLTGKIVSIHQNGKIGRIKDSRGNIISFHKKDLIKKLKNLQSINGNTVEFYSIKSYDGKFIGEQINVLRQAQTSSSESLIGKSFDAIVKNVTEFGIFFNIEKIKTDFYIKMAFQTKLRATLRRFSLTEIK